MKEKIDVVLSIGAEAEATIFGPPPSICTNKKQDKR
jgi:hypothetical protein